MPLLSPLPLHQLGACQLSLPQATTPSPPVIHPLCRAKETELKTKLFLRGKSNFSTLPGRPSGMWVLPNPLLLQPHFSSLPALAIPSLSFSGLSPAVSSVWKMPSPLHLLFSQITSLYLSVSASMSPTPGSLSWYLSGWARPPPIFPGSPLLWFWAFVRWERRCSVSQR